MGNNTATPNLDEEKVTALKDFLDNELETKSADKMAKKGNDQQNNVDKNNEKKYEMQDIEELIINYEPDDGIDKLEKEMVDTIKRVDRQGWEQGVGYKSGFELFDENLNGIQPGFSIIGADSNVGKSSFLLNVGFNTALNDDVYSLYFSFDDDASNLLPRIVAMRQNIPINAIRMPQSYQDYPAILDRRRQGLKELYNMTDKFKLIDSEDTRDTEVLKEVIGNHMEYANRHNRGLFVLIDSFHDIKTGNKRFNNDNEKCEHIADELESYAKENNIPVWCTSELKKLNAYRRPINDDIRHSSRIKYEAKLILLLHNEVSQKGKAEAAVYYRNPDRPGKSPVIEVDFSKNKLSSYKGRLYFNFIPEYAKIIEADREEKERYDTMVHQGDD